MADLDGRPRTGATGPANWKSLGQRQSADALFTPFQIGRTRLRNRIAMAPMTRNFSPRGVPGEDVAAYYRSRVLGGAGLLIGEGTHISHPGANGGKNVPAFWGAAALDGWKRVIETVHAADGVMFPQLWHVGVTRRPGAEPDPSVPGFGPVDIVENGVTVVKKMTRADIAAVIESYAQAAHDAERLGFDGLEIHGAHGYLLDSFVWKVSNRRDDEYGGPLENRIRLAVEVVRAIRAAVSRDFPVCYRFSQWKTRDYEARSADTPEELAGIVKPLAAAGVDIFHASARRYWEPAFPGSSDNLAVWAKRLSGKPVIMVGSAGLNVPYASTRMSPQQADAVIGYSDISPAARLVQAGSVDMVAIGRALLSEPEWPNKIRARRFDDIRPVNPTARDTLVY